MEQISKVVHLGKQMRIWKQGANNFENFLSLEFHFDKNCLALRYRRKAFLYELNTSGKYFAFKEQMKVRSR